MKACKDHDIAFREQKVSESFEEICNVIEDLLASKKPCDALIACDDEIAVAALKLCAKYDIQVPEDVQVTGFNNSVLSQVCSPELTSFDNRVEYLCRSGMMAVMQALKNKDHPFKTLYSGKLIVRNSTRKD